LYCADQQTVAGLGAGHLKEVPLGGVDVIEIDFVGNDGDARAGADPHRAPQAITGKVLNSGCVTVLSGALIHSHSTITVIALSGGVVRHRVYAPLLAGVIWQSERGIMHAGRAAASAGDVAPMQKERT
jgi:hypothetical protein